MANWSLPTITDLYTNFLSYLKSRDDDAARMQDTRVTAATNVPDYSKRWNDTTKTIQNWLSSTWTSLVMGVAGGGTGASTAAGARTNLDVYSKAEVDAAAAVSLTSVKGNMASEIAIGANLTYYAGASVSLPAGTWLVMGVVRWGTNSSNIGAGTVSAYLYSGAAITRYASDPFENVAYIYNREITLNDVLVLGSTTTVSVGVMRSGGTSALYMRIGTHIVAVKIA